MKNNLIGKKAIIEHTDYFYFDYDSMAKHLGATKWSSKARPNICHLFVLINASIREDGYGIIYLIEDLDTREQFLTTLGSLRILAD